MSATKQHIFLGRPIVALACITLALSSVACDNTTTRKLPPPGSRVDAFEQVAVGKVDALFIVDNSGSMADKQANVARNFEEFFKVISDAQVDYHIGVLTTDTVSTSDRAKLKGNPAVITPSTPNPVAAFAANVKVGTNGNAQEKGLDAARLFFSVPQPDFLRTDAYLFMIFLSDEDDNSLPGEPRYFYRLFEGLKGKGNDGMVMMSAIVGDIPNGCCSSDKGCLPESGGWKANAGTRYKEVSDLTGGRIVSICDQEFGTSLRQLGIDAVGLQRAFKLSKTPNQDTLSVEVTYPCNTNQARLNAVCDSQQNQCSGSSGSGILCKVKKAPDFNSVGWVFQPNQNTIYFQGESVPPKSARIEITYYEPGVEVPAQ
jgi:hypothetical protein